jgi:NUMOD1 domain
MNAGAEEYLQSSSIVQRMDASKPGDEVATVTSYSSSTSIATLQTESEVSGSRLQYPMALFAPSSTPSSSNMQTSRSMFENLSALEYQVADILVETKRSGSFYKLSDEVLDPVQSFLPPAPRRIAPSREVHLYLSSSEEEENDSEEDMHMTEAYLAVRRKMLLPVVRNKKQKHLPASLVHNKSKKPKSSSNITKSDTRPPLLARGKENFARNNQGRRIEKVRQSTGKVTAKYSSVTAAADSISCSQSTIRKILLGTYPCKSMQGWTFRYEQQDAESFENTSSTDASDGSDKYEEVDQEDMGIEQDDEEEFNNAKVEDDQEQENEVPSGYRKPRKIEKINVKTGEVVATFDSIVAASKTVDFSYTTIRRIMDSNCPWITSRNGWTFRDVDDADAESSNRQTTANASCANIEKKDSIDSNETHGFHKNEPRLVQKINVKTSKVVGTFNNIREAADSWQYSREIVRQLAAGTHRQGSKDGWTFRYVSPDDTATPSDHFCNGNDHLCEKRRHDHQYKKSMGVKKTKLSGVPSANKMPSCKLVAAYSLGCTLKLDQSEPFKSKSIQEPVITNKKNPGGHPPRAVEQVDIETGLILGTYGSLTEASDKTGVPRRMITYVAKGEKKSTKPFTFRYAVDVKRDSAMLLANDSAKTKASVILSGAKQSLPIDDRFCKEIEQGVPFPCEKRVSPRRKPLSNERCGKNNVRRVSPRKKTHTVIPQLVAGNPTKTSMIPSMMYEFLGVTLEQKGKLGLEIKQCAPPRFLLSELGTKFSITLEKGLQCLQVVKWNDEQGIDVKMGIRANDWIFCKIAASSHLLDKKGALQLDYHDVSAALLTGTRPINLVLARELKTNNNGNMSESTTAPK